MANLAGKSGWQVWMANLDGKSGWQVRMASLGTKSGTGELPGWRYGSPLSLPESYLENQDEKGPPTEAAYRGGGLVQVS